MVKCEGNDEAVNLLLGILSNEIARDGGISLVKEIPVYIGKKRLHSLLKPKKLLAFLEQHPRLFQVSDRTVHPHVVRLLSKDYCTTSGTATVQQPVVDQSRCVLHDRILCALQKETLRNKRRAKTGVVTGFGINWLLKQCKYELHYHLRALGWYLNQGELLLLDSEVWYNSVLKMFCQLVADVCDIVDERVHLRQSAQATTKIETSCPRQQENVVNAIIKSLEGDGGTHLSHSLLMHRYPNLRTLLSGYDMRQLLDGYHPVLDVFVHNHEIYFRLRQEDYSSESKILLQVDETGLFSVASSKYAKAFVNFLLRHADDCCRIALDLTASVGGLTLALAKQPRIDHVVAIEIDPHRSELCRQNMLTHQVSHKVEVRVHDSYQIIPDLSYELKEHKEIIIVLDPPWGGIYYKENPQRMQMGPWSLLQVLHRISECFSNSVVGIRLPVNYNVTTLCDSLKYKDVSVQVLQAKKVGPQLFVYLRF